MAKNDKEDKTTQTAPLADLIPEDKKPFFKKWINIIAHLCLAASIITALTPSSVENQYLQKFINTLNVIALNFGFNANADSPAVDADCDATELPPVEKN